MTAVCSFCGLVIDGGSSAVPLVGLDDEAKRLLAQHEFVSLCAFVFVHQNESHRDTTIQVHRWMAQAGHCEAMEHVTSADPAVKRWHDSLKAELLDRFAVAAV